jgi:hypothetical protein
MWVVEVTPAVASPGVMGGGTTPYLFDSKPNIVRDLDVVAIKSSDRVVELNWRDVFSIDLRELAATEIEKRLR